MGTQRGKKLDPSIEKRKGEGGEGRERPIKTIFPAFTCFPKCPHPFFPPPPFFFPLSVRTNPTPVCLKVGGRKCHELRARGGRGETRGKAPRKKKKKRKRAFIFIVFGLFFLPSPPHFASSAGTGCSKKRTTKRKTLTKHTVQFYLLVFYLEIQKFFRHPSLPVSFPGVP